MKTVKIAQCLPWYEGPDRDCSANMLVFQHYLGRLQERSRAQVFGNGPGLPLLDPVNTTGESELRPGDPIFEFAITEEVGCSLVGLARERCAENAIGWGADYLFFYDDDMLFGTDIFLRLFRAHQEIGEPAIVAALAFTGRDPITPVIYKFNDYDYNDGRMKFESEPVYDYQPNALQKVDAIGGGVLLISADALRKIPRPWFKTTGIGEDIFLCAMAKTVGVPVYVDTRAKTIHKPTFIPEQLWADERRYLALRKAQSAA